MKRLTLLSFILLSYVPAAFGGGGARTGKQIINEWELGALVIAAIIIIVLPRKLRTTIMGIIIGLIVVYLLVINFDTLMGVAHELD